MTSARARARTHTHTHTVYIYMVYMYIHVYIFIYIAHVAQLRQSRLLSRSWRTSKRTKKNENTSVGDEERTFGVVA